MNSSISKFRQRKLNNLAKDIIEKNQYVSLATVSVTGEPWISPVVYAYDSSWNLYFVSKPSSRHCQNIASTQTGACAIFDSTQNWGEGVGLQIEAEIKETTMAETLKAGKCYIGRKYPFGNPDAKIVVNFIQDLVAQKKIYKFYKISPKTIWINNPYSKTDKRVPVYL